MGDYFKPWQRKIGVVTLVMACLLTVGWARSYITNDGVGIAFGDRYQSLNSFDGNLCLLQNTWRSRNLMRKSSIRFWIGKDVDVARAGLLEARISSSGTSDQIAILRGAGITPTTEQLKWVFTELTIPYWSIVIPLTLLSACLMLSKPRAKTKN